MLRRIRSAAAFCFAVASSVSLLAQTAQDGRLIVTVVDASGAVVSGATVTISGLDDGARASAFPPVTSSDKGVATLERLLPGRYSIKAEFPGFELGVLPEVRIHRGDNRHVVVLPLKRVEESVTVGQNAQAAAADPRGSAFKTVLTREEIENLSDDPAEMAQQLQDLAGGNAIIRVDSFAGAPLPPKALIKSVHIVRDPFAAENHSAESEGIPRAWPRRHRVDNEPLSPWAGRADGTCAPRERGNRSDAQPEDSRECVVSVGALRRSDARP